MTRDDSAAGGTGPPRFAGLHLLGLSAFAFAQPLFDLLAGEATFFVARRSQAADVLLLAAALTLGPALALWLIESMVTRLSPGLGRCAHLFFVTGLVALIVMPLLTRGLSAGAASRLPGGAIAGLSLATGAVAAWAYSRWPPATTLATLLAAAAPLFAAGFLLDDAIARIAFEQPTSPSSTQADPAVDATTSVVLVVLDELPITSLLNSAGTFDAALFPNFARFADHATWYRNTTTVHSYTQWALPALLTGNYPRDIDKLPIARDHPDNLFTLLGDSYRMRVLETVTDLCPPELLDDIATAGRAGLGARLASLAHDLPVVYAHIVLPPDLASGLPPIDLGWSDFADPTTGASPTGAAGGGHTPTERGAARDQTEGEPAKRREGGAQERLGRTRHFRALATGDRAAGLADFAEWIDDSTAPTLYYVHVVLPHAPWTYLPSGRRYVDNGVIHSPGSEVWSGHPWLTLQALRRHLLQTGLTDALLGDIIDQLQARDRYDDSLVIVLADHGISFHPGTERREAMTDNASDVAWVPLLLKLPGQRDARIDDRNAELIDVLPTIADVLDVPLPWDVDGHSLLEASPPRPHKTVFRRHAPEPLRLPPGRPAAWPGLERKLEFIGAASDWRDVFAAGPLAELAGRHAADLPAATREGVSAQLDGAAALRNVDLSGGLVPAHVVGRIQAGPGHALPEFVALSLNGRVQSVAPAMPLPTADGRSGEADVSFLLSDEALREGANDVTLFAIVESGGHVALAPLLLPTWELQGGAGRTQLRRSDGRVVEIRPDALQGSVYGATVEDGRLRLVGWAADVDRSRVSDAIVVTADDVPIFSGTSRQPMDRIARRFDDPALRDAGFVHELPLQLFDGDPRGRLRVFAVCGDVATELPHSGEADWVRP